MKNGMGLPIPFHPASFMGQVLKERRTGSWQRGWERITTLHQNGKNGWRDRRWEKVVSDAESRSTVRLVFIIPKYPIDSTIASATFASCILV